jgi:hypothetical protein
MKTIIHSAQNLPRLISNPLNVTALPLFFALAFLPSILRLAWHDFPVANPMTAFGPVIAGFWLAAGIREIRVSFALLGTLITTLIWTANWLMMAGGGCCSTLGNS